MTSQIDPCEFAAKREKSPMAGWYKMCIDTMNVSGNRGFRHVKSFTAYEYMYIVRAINSD
jgi:hypothetical protein